MAGRGKGKKDCHFYGAVLGKRAKAPTLILAYWFCWGFFFPTPIVERSLREAGNLQSIPVVARGIRKQKRPTAEIHVFYFPPNAKADE